MPAATSFDYALIRVVPRVEREEFVNVGIILLCRPLRFLVAGIELNQPRLSALFGELDFAQLQTHLDLIPTICKGGKKAGYIGMLSQQERFHWLTAPRSTIIQTSRPHSGLCTDPAKTLENLLDRMVR